MAALPHSHLRGRDLQLAALDHHLSEVDAGTVSHLRNIFAKVGVKSRVQLASAMSETAE